ncbi:CpaD family pilus assembly protein [Methylobacterium nodulans]|uniref:Pilus (Caulobacter type) biogenesis lipoprotein CpaD n=1 Tax=Methylobacterium nodulans (strain LMG 21967 / CNCM I-2342 / ORS 2060) TaxID=460265 RepID=B8IGQ4_METNO|nr:CpaD family pilus assembly protein [Methylobacterium nodulans]ACL57779.1 pilus (Caulobacter type) biogenesis lipoprotein CpaD [Methylobacterium nodulans ORS 2060]
MIHFLRPASRPALRAVSIGALALSLGACVANRAATTGSVYPSSVAARHPIVLADAPRSLDVFVTGIGHVDPRQSDDIDAFLLEYRRYGRGVLVIEVPRGAQVPGPAVARTAALLRERAVGRGVPARELVVAPYAVVNPAVAAPVRMSFQRMQARVSGACGLWPQDLGVSEPGFELRNESFWNYGCSTRANFASQIADPVDLVRGRQEGRIDTVSRTQDIESLRTGKDPSTSWKQDGQASVKSQVGQ